MEVGSLREKIIVALLLYKFGETNVVTEIPITEPEVDVKLYGEANNKLTYEAIIEIMKRQKLIDSNKDKNEKLGIGGSIHLLYLNPDYQFIWECYNFPDINKAFQEMLLNICKSNIKNVANLFWSKIESLFKPSN